MGSATVVHGHIENFPDQDWTCPAWQADSSPLCHFPEICLDSPFFLMEVARYYRKSFCCQFHVISRRSGAKRRAQIEPLSWSQRGRSCRWHPGRQQPLCLLQKSTSGSHAVVRSPGTLPKPCPAGKAFSGGIAPQTCFKWLVCHHVLDFFSCSLWPPFHSHNSNETRDSNNHTRERKWGVWPFLVRSSAAFYSLRNTSNLT